MPAAFPEVFAVAGTIAETGTPEPDCTNAGLPNAQRDAAAYFTTDGAFDPASRTGVTVSAVSEAFINHFADPFLGVCYALLHGTLSTRALILPGDDPTDPNTEFVSRLLPCPFDAVNCPADAIGTSFAAPRIAGIAALLIDKSGTLPASGADVESIRTAIRNSADRRDSESPAPGLDFAPLDQPYTGAVYTFDGEREGIGQAPQ